MTCPVGVHEFESATADDYAEHYTAQVKPEQLALEVGEVIPSRTRTYNRRYCTAGTMAAIARLVTEESNGTKRGGRRPWSWLDRYIVAETLQLAGGQDVEELGAPACSDTAGQIGRALGVEAQTVRNALNRAYKTGVLAKAHGRVYWRKGDPDDTGNSAAVRVFKPGSKSGPRVIIPGWFLVELVDGFKAL